MQDHSRYKASLPHGETAQQHAKQGHGHDEFQRESQMATAVDGRLQQESQRQVSGERGELPHQVPPVHNLLTDSGAQRERDPEEPFT